jgi:hypothetical protein
MSRDVASDLDERNEERSKGMSYRPKWFRVGMAFPADPAPFILAAQATHIRAPEPATGSGLLSVECVGEVEEGETLWYRLYLPPGKSFFQVHLDGRGDPGECRYFSLLDAITPASPEEWAFWLDERQGLIGWPEFETKDGRRYGRVWAGGEHKVPPRHLYETRRGASSEGLRTHQAMLYAAPTEAPAPAPPTEYILVAALEEGRAAWVEVHAGIDVSIGALNLS